MIGAQHLSAVAKPAKERGVHACPRCGHKRQARPSSLCEDCRFVLTVAERLAWAA